VAARNVLVMESSHIITSSHHQQTQQKTMPYLWRLRRGIETNRSHRLNIPQQTKTKVNIMAQKQHEILAVKTGITGKFNKLKADLVSLFNDKKHHFNKVIAVFKPLKEGAQQATEQQTEMQTTVVKELQWIGTEFGKLVDICHSINLTNCVAKADVVIDGVTVLSEIPATGLLELEKLIGSFKDLLTTVPTLDPVKGFKPDADEGKGIYKAQEQLRARTTKELYVLELSPATDKHPAQVSKETRDVLVGHVYTNEWSGMLTPAEKSTMLTRCEDLLTAIKSAQARANNTEVVSKKIGDSIVKYIIG
jgi:hypothetical protein